VGKETKTKKENTPTYLSCPTNSAAHDVAVDVDARKTLTIDKTARGLLPRA
jgi:hypothetical protein